MGNRITGFFRGNFTGEGRRNQKLKRNLATVDEITDEYFHKNLGQQLHRDGMYRTGHDYGKHLKINDIFYPRDILSYPTRNELYLQNPTLRSVIIKKTQEVNRNGISVKKLFVRKCMRTAVEPCKNLIHQTQADNGGKIESCEVCPNPDMPSGQEACGEEFETEVVRCTECKATTRSPDIKQKQFLNKIMKKHNKNKRALPSILKQMGIDGEKHDNAFLVSDYLYFFEKDPNVDRVPLTPTGKALIQSYQGQPEFIRPIIDYDGSLGSNYYTCINHREVFERFQEYKGAQFDYLKHPRCKIELTDMKGSICSKPLQKVEYVYLRFNTQNSEMGDTGVSYSYIKGEVEHLKIYSPATAMGKSLIDSLYYIILQLNGQTKWIAEYYIKMRMYKGFLDLPYGTKFNHKAVAAWARAELLKWREDQWYMPIMLSPEGSKGVKYTRIDDSPKEMQFIENREEARRLITTMFGVSNVFMGDASAGAGLNNQGLELVVTNRGVKHNQTSIDEQILIPYCASVLEISMDELEYAISYNTNEEQDLMAEKQRKALDIANAAAAQGIGAKITINTEGDFVISAQKEGEALVPAGNGQGLDFENVDGMNHDGKSKETRSQSKPMQGAPNEPKVQGSELTVKGNGNNHYDAINVIMDLFRKMQE